MRYDPWLRLRMTAYADAEPLLTDSRLSEVEEKVRRKYRLPDETVFVTAIVQPPEPNDLECHFLLISPHPKLPVATVRDSSRVTWTAWRQEKLDNDFQRRYGMSLEEGAFRVIAKQHKEKLDSLRSMID